MTIKLVNGVSENKNPCRSICSSKTSNISSSRLIRISFSGKDSCSSSRALGPNANREIKSPYFNSDKVQLPSRITERKPANKKPADFISSFPLAVSIYKANSDEFKLKKRGKKKVKKSVLTLPNQQTPLPKTYTVSDLNDSEYFNEINHEGRNDKLDKPKKRRSVKCKKKPRLQERAMEFFDRDARYCSQLNIDLDCSSSDTLNFTGDGERITKLYKSHSSIKGGNDPNDVWTVLRNINEFQCRAAPPVSQEGVRSLKKRKPAIRQKNNCNNTHIFETCRTEEFSYISSFELDSKSHDSCSPSSSFDRITVIDKQSEPEKVKEQFSQNILGSNMKFRGQIKSNLSNTDRKGNRNKLRIKSKQFMHNKKNINEVPEKSTPTDISNIELENVSTFCDAELLPKLQVANKTAKMSKYVENGSDDQASSLVVNRSDNTYKYTNAKSLIKSQNTGINAMKSKIVDSEKQMNGITKVILSRGQDIVSSKLSELRKPRQALTLPNANIPKLSQAEIKRRLANLKFPIVVLGKDQLTNCGIPVVNYEPPQFDGLDKHIWPFMLEWIEEKYSRNIQNNQKKEIIKPKNSKVKSKMKHHDDLITKMGDSFINNNNTNVSKKANENKQKNNSTVSKYDNNRESSITEVSSRLVQNLKPMSLIKNKMLQFLHKNHTSTKVSEIKSNNCGQVEKVQNNKRIGTSEITKTSNNQSGTGSYIYGSRNVVAKESAEYQHVKKAYSSLGAKGNPWAKGKWASDFIENIIKKIRSGVYYGVGNRETEYIITDSEVSTQTEENFIKNDYYLNSVLDAEYELEEVLNNKDDTLKDILKYDNSLSTLEIETITANQIAVKHCVTNVVVHFDIQVLGETKTAIHKNMESVSYIPVHRKENNEKIFKCNASIVNAFLPAELCSIIPNMMQTILNTGKSVSLFPAPLESGLCHLTPVTEFKGANTELMYSFLPGNMISDEMRRILIGRYQYPINTLNYKNIERSHLLHKNRVDSIVSLLPGINTQVIYFTQQSIILHLSESNIGTSKTYFQNHVQYTNRFANCMALQRYEPKNLSIIPSFGIFNATDFVQKIISKMYLSELYTKIKILNYHLISNKNNIISIRGIIHQQSQNNNAIPLMPIANHRVISLYDATNKSDNAESTDKVTHSITGNGIEGEEKTHTTNNRNKTDQLRKKAHPVKILRKKSYVKCYRKCNSLSSILNYKCTPLNKIKNLDDFCQALCSNSFCNVLDGYLEKKILAAVREMENWIFEITPKQALLILLLSNKKDTSNLIRFRPVLLQGIAVNRITKAVELDTEIEVIESENFHKLPQYEGFSYVPASAENQDSLLEELYWIAKTTASDYQKKFDESSEKLLKSLLEKRKKLNPSYLRVMARYVGLGLLTPLK